MVPRRIPHVCALSSLVKARRCGGQQLEEVRHAGHGAVARGRAWPACGCWSCTRRQPPLHSTALTYALCFYCRPSWRAWRWAWRCRRQPAAGAARSGRGAGPRAAGAGRLRAAAGGRGPGAPHCFLPVKRGMQAAGCWRASWAPGASTQPCALQSTPRSNPDTHCSLHALFYTLRLHRKL